MVDEATEGEGKGDGQQLLLHDLDLVVLLLTLVRLLDLRFQPSVLATSQELSEKGKEIKTIELFHSLQQLLLHL